MPAQLDTLDIEVEVDRQGRVVIDLPNLAPGRHRLQVKVLDEAVDTTGGSTRPRLDLPAWAWTNWPADCSFSRDLMYADDPDG